VRSVAADCVELFLWIRKRNIVGEFGRISEPVVGVEIGTV